MKKLILLIKEKLKYMYFLLLQNNINNVDKSLYSFKM